MVLGLQRYLVCSNGTSTVDLPWAEAGCCSILETLWLQVQLGRSHTSPLDLIGISSERTC